MFYHSENRPACDSHLVARNAGSLCRISWLHVRKVRQFRDVQILPGDGERKVTLPFKTARVLECDGSNKVAIAFKCPAMTKKPYADFVSWRMAGGQIIPQRIRLRRVHYAYFS